MTDNPFKFSPHTWRCFYFIEQIVIINAVFSTYVEVFPSYGYSETTSRSFLHIRGGVSDDIYDWVIDDMFSPHTWRCFIPGVHRSGCRGVFSTYVEVFPKRFAAFLTIFCFLHIRGGVSFRRHGNKVFIKFSPHTWRCFLRVKNELATTQVFSTYVEVFHNSRRSPPVHSSFLHIRGGVS